MLAALALSVTLAPTVLTDCLAIESVGRGGRIPFPTDMIVQARVNGDLGWPKEGDAVGERKWTPAKANTDGWFEGRAFSGGYAAFTVTWPRDEVVLMNAAGSGMVYANDEPRGGDVYGFGYGRLPVALKAGENHLLVSTGRGRLRVTLESPAASVCLNPADLTLPDVVRGSKDPLFGGIIVVNATERRVRDHKLVARVGAERVETKVPEIPPLSARKCRFDLPNLSATAADTVEVSLDMVEGDATVDSTKITLRVRKPDQSRRETFVSGIDGSVQYYAVVPPPDPKPGLALVLTVHGASVEAQGQAEAYSAKPWCWIVAATNRRPYGFDWEDWGRMDAMEVLEIARRKFGTNPDKTFLTGHSMGGHGTWQLGALFPNVFAAIAPSAGWRSFYTYVGKPRIEKPTPMEAFFERAASPTDTERWADNYATEDVFILHGDADDNVPVTEARAMRDYFEKVKKPIGYFEQKGAGHWWDGDRSPGADCVDWPEIFSMFEKGHLARWKGTPLEGMLKFVTPNPAISSRMDFVEIRRQERKLEPSRIEVTANKDGMSLKTENVKGLRTGIGVATIDGQPLPKVSTRTSVADFEKVNGTWQFAERGIPMQTGPFKEAFQKGMVFVYGTHGTHEENDWSFAKARYDAEQWWYRGNGAVDLVADNDFNATNARNVVVYGNRDCNLLWQRLLITAPIQVGKGFAKVDTKTVRADLGVLFAVEVDGRMVAGVGGTSVKGMRTTERLPYFSAGLAYPDWTLIGADAPTAGTGGVVGAGFWGEPGVWKP